MLGRECSRALPRRQSRRPRRPRARRPGHGRTTCRCASTGEWVDADVRITTGFVEPHFFAGFSGGPEDGRARAGRPGDDADAARRAAHRRSAGHLGHHPRATRSTTRARDRRWRPASTSPSTCCSTASSGSPARSPASPRRCTRARLRAARARGDAAGRRPFDVVVTTNSGYPLDQNLYQAVKGMSAAAEIVATAARSSAPPSAGTGSRTTAGTASCCALGPLPRSSAAIIAAAPVTIPDQWQVQIRRGSRQARVLVHTDGLAPAQVRAAHLECGRHRGRGGGP